MYLNNIDDDVNPGVVHADEEEYDTTPSAEDYGDMPTNSYCIEGSITQGKMHQTTEAQRSMSNTSSGSHVIDTHF
jgi:hypothetical protein